MDRRRTFPAMIRNRLEEPAPESLDAVNLSTAEVEVDEMIEAIREGSMPPWRYKPNPPGARLFDQEKQGIRGLEATFGAGGAQGMG
jgi:hypothetical protein